jgi:hypothetical protein
MKPILLAAFSLFLVAGTGCGSTRSGNRMVSFDHDSRPGRYKGEKELTNSIFAVIKDDDGRPIPDVVVELYSDDRMINYVSKVMTGVRGRFNFTVKEGIYLIVINHPKFKEARLIVPVKGNDIDLNEIRLAPFFD